MRPSRRSALTAAWLERRAMLTAAVQPHGRQVAITSSRIPAGAGDEVIEIVLLDVASGAVTPLGAARLGDHTPAWSPDGARLAFLTDRHGITQVAVARPGDSGPQLVTSSTGSASGAVGWSPDGTRFAVAATRGRGIDHGRPYRVTRAVPWGDGIGPLDDPPQLFVVDATTGATQQLTDDEWRWSLPRWSPDGTTIAARASHDPSGRRRGMHLRTIDIGGRRATPPTMPDVPGGFAVVPVWTNDGRLVVLSVQPEGRPLGSQAQLHVIDRHGAVQPLHERAPHALAGDVYGDNAGAVGVEYDTAIVAVSSESGHQLYLRHQHGGRMGVSRLTLPADRRRPTETDWEVVVDGDRAATPLGLVGGDLIVADQAAGRAPELIAVDLVGHRGDRARERRIGDRLFDTPEPMTADVHRLRIGEGAGDQVPDDAAATASDAWMLVPPGASGPLPTVVVVHGGPNAAFGEVFSLDAQALCAAGFGVLYANPRGSTGSGDAFAHAVHGDWGGAPVDDLLATIDRAIALGWVDGERLGVTGNSYGGYLSAWMACTTDRFRAAVAENPVTDLLSMYGTSDIGATFLPGQLGVAPIDDLAPYLHLSPVLRARGCTTPMLFVVGTADHRCPPSQAFELHRALCAHGSAPSEVLVLPGESHEGSTFGRPASRLAHDDALVEWMERWLLA